MANFQVQVENGNNVLVTLDRGVSGVGIENVESVFISPNYFLKFTYTNGTTENVLLPATGTGLVSFNTRVGVVTLTSADVIDALGYVPLSTSDMVADITDIGTDPNQIPLNQFLGTMAYQDLPNVELSLRPIVPLTSPTVQDVIDALLALGLVIQED
jgi:hypothetical protein